MGNSVFTGRRVSYGGVSISSPKSSGDFDRNWLMVSRKLSIKNISLNCQDFRFFTNILLAVKLTFQRIQFSAQTWLYIMSGTSNGVNNKKSNIYA